MNYDRLLQLGGIDREVPPIPGYITKEQLQGEIDDINTLIPEEATDTNQLADKQYVNDKVSTDSATFRGTYNLVSDLSLTTAATHADIATALASAISTADNNDYCYVEIPTADAKPTEIAKTERYKFNGTAWGYEYGKDSFTSTQWAAINSGISSGLVSKLSDLPTNAELTNLLNGKQATISDLNEIRNGAASGASAYQKPSFGIPSTDLSSGVQSSLQKAEGAAPQNTTYTKVEINGLFDNEKYRTQNLAAIMSLSVDSNAGVTTVTTNPEWKVVYTDANDAILMGKRQDNTWYFATDLDTILDTIIDGYSTT